MAELLSKGLDALPPNALAAVVAGCVFGSVMAVLGKHGPTALRKYLPSGLAFGIAFIVPAYYSVAMFLGAMIFLAWKRRNPSGAEKLGFSIASGLIAGEGLMGIIVAVLTLLGIQPLT